MVLEAYTSPNSSFSREYIGNKVYENGILKRILLPNGYISNGNYYFYLRDHLGNNVVTASYDFHARTLEEYGSFTTVDPLAEKYYSISPYACCAGNPIRFIDPDGRADFSLSGKIIGNDGVDDRRILVIKTTEKSFESSTDKVTGAVLSKKDQKATVDFIKANSGNTEVFQNDGTTYTKLKQFVTTKRKDMRKILIFIVLFSVLSPLIGQNTNQLNEVIISSINSYIEWNNDFVKRGISLMDTSSYYICMDGLPANFPLDSVQHIVFFSLNNLEGLPNAFKRKLNKGLKTLFVDFNLLNNQLTITIAGRGVKRVKKNNIKIVIGDWGIFTYKYSCDSQIWELKETRFGGI